MHNRHKRHQTTRRKKDPNRLTNLGVNLQRAQKSLGISQEDLAELLSAYSGEHVSRAMINGWYSGNQPRGEQRRKNILDALDHVLRLTPEENDPIRPTPISLDDRQDYIASLMAQGYTLNQIAEAGDVALITLKSWMTNPAIRIKHSRWNRFKSLVEAWMIQLRALDYIDHVMEAQYLELEERRRKLEG